MSPQSQTILQLLEKNKVMEAAAAAPGGTTMGTFESTPMIKSSIETTPYLQQNHTPSQASISNKLFAKKNKKISGINMRKTPT